MSDIRAKGIIDQGNAIFTRGTYSIPSARTFYKVDEYLQSTYPYPKQRFTFKTSYAKPPEVDAQSIHHIRDCTIRLIYAVTTIPLNLGLPRTVSDVSVIMRLGLTIAGPQPSRKELFGELEKIIIANGGELETN